MKQQTAVDWLIQEFNNKGIDIGGGYKMSNFIPDEMIQQAKEMEKQQIKTAYNKGYQDGEIDSLDAKDSNVEFFEDAEQYYNETYGQ